MPRARSPHPLKVRRQVEVPLLAKSAHHAQRVGLDAHRVRQGLQGVIVTALATTDTIPCGGECRRGNLKDGVVGDIELPLWAEPRRSAIPQIPFHRSDLQTGAPNVASVTGRRGALSL